MKLFNKTARFLSLAAVGALCLGTAVTAQAGPGSAEISVNVTFSRALIVYAGDPIQFGNILINANAGTVNLDKDTGALTYSGGVVAADGATASRGYIGFVAPRPGSLGITYESVVPLTNTNTGDIVNFSPAAKVNNYTVTTYNDEVTIEVGGSLNFPINTTEGLYSGSLTLTVDYI